MSDSVFNSLNQAGKAISSSKTAEEKLSALTHAFEVFSQETTRLEAGYASLKAQFQDVNLQLEETNTKLQNKIFEFHIMMNYLTSILNNISQGILFIGLNGTITTYNSKAEKLLGIPIETTLFSNYWDVFDDHIFGFSMKEAIAQQKAPERTYVTFQRQNQSAAELEVNATFILEGPHLEKEADLSSLDFHKGVIILIRDITEIRRLQLLTNRNDRMKMLGEMAAMVAHEIRNPLGGIKGFASLLARDLKDQPDQCQMANYIVEGTDNLNRVVTDVLNYSRPITLKVESLDLVPILSEIRQHVLIDSLLSKGITIVISTQLKELIAPIDSQLFKSVLLNLMVNAIQAMPNGGEIDINLSKENNQAVIQIIDSGVGIPAENLEKIFSPFFTTKPQGHGFGLAEAYRIIQGHQGTIEVSSIIGKGSTFTIKIPLESI